MRDRDVRLEEILLTFHQTNHVIFLTGTKRPRAHCSPVTHSVLAGYRLFEWGYGMGRWTNRHAGLIVAVKIDLCEIWQIREVASPDASVQGRGGAIRIKTAEKKDSSTCHHRTDPVVRTGKIFCAAHVKMVGCEGVQAEWPPPEPLDCKMNQLQNLLTWKENF